MQPDPTNLIEKIDLTTPIVGFYDSPDPSPFAPLVTPKAGRHHCIFMFYNQWTKGETLHLTRENYGCGGAGRWLYGEETRTREEFVKFLVDEEGLKATSNLMEQWLEHAYVYQQKHPNILIGPLRETEYEYLKTITFYVNPDQLSVLLLGAQYYSALDDPILVSAPFGSGCMQLTPMFDDLHAPQAVVGATDIAMRQFLPSDVLAFTVTKPLFEQLVALDERSFLYKPFWQRLRKARGLADS